MQSLFLKLLLIVLIVFLSGCMVGPNFVSPREPQVCSYGVGGDCRKVGAQQISTKKCLVVNWWQEFNCEKLDKVIAVGIARNNDFRSMQASLAQAKELVKAKCGLLWPQISLSGGAGRQAYGVALFGPTNFAVPPFTYYEVGPNANWTLDIFGGTRRSIEKQKALMAYQGEEYNAAFLSLTGNIAATAVTIATIQEQIKTTQQIIAEDEKNYQLVQKAFHAGSATKTEVLSAQSQKENDETLLPPLHQQLSVASDALCVLLSTFPANCQTLDFELSNFTLPRVLPLVLPSELVHKRPDILAAEAVLHAACANIGIATANLYPNINLSGSLLLEALLPSNLFAYSATAWSLLGTATAPVFSGGTLRAERRAAIDAYISAYYNYQQVVIKAFAQVNDVLKALQHDEQALCKERQAVSTAKDSLRLARLSYDAGNVGVLQVLEAERLYNQARLGYVQAKAQRYQDVIQLYLVSGGGIKSCGYQTSPA